MIFYSIKLGETTLDWAGTQAEAKQLVKNHQLTQQGEIVEWGEEEVPVDKPSLLTWLRVNALGERKAKH